MGEVSRRVRQALGGCASLAMGTLVSVPSAVAAESAGLCDKQITKPSSDATGYRLRDDRCEGTFRQPTSAAGERQVGDSAWSDRRGHPGSGTAVSQYPCASASVYSANGPSRARQSASWCGGFR